MKTTFQDLLNGSGIGLDQVLVLRHTPKERRLRESLRRLAADRPSVFNGYQQTQTARVEKQMARAKYVASFIGHRPSQALFVGLYRNDGRPRALSRDDYSKVPANRELESLGVKGWTDKETRSSVLWFNLKIMDFCQHLAGKLVVRWPPKEINWARFAGGSRNGMEILSVLKASALSTKKPDWDEVEALGTEGDDLQPSESFADEVPFPTLFVEGAVRRVAVNAYERNPQARRACLEHHGYCCKVCGFDFAKSYGERGNEYIHVHHLKDLASIGKSYRVNPIEDLNPVCPNCHAMIHRWNPALTIEELQSIVKAARGN